jgi:hypothetical protein
MTTLADEVIREVRRVRHEISRRCGHDPHKVVAWYRAFQDELKESGKYCFFQPAAADHADGARTDVAERVGP